MSSTSSGSVPVFVYYHTHWDREWYQPFRAYQVRLGEVVDAVLERLETGVLPCFTLDGQTVVLDDYLEFRPENKSRLEALVRSGQITIGPWYVMPDEFLVCGESLVRNLQRGMATSKSWGCERFTGYLPDTFGHSADMPLIFRQCGIETAVVWRGVNPDTSAFLWAGRDGTSVLAYHLVAGYFQNMLHDPQLSEAERIEALKALVTQGLAKAGPQHTMLLPIGADHLGPVSAEGKALLAQAISDFREGHPPDYLRHYLENGLSRGEIPKITGELRDHHAAFILQGVYSARLYLKQANRRLEHRLIRHTEAQVAMAQLLLPPHKRPRIPRKELETAWMLLLQNHPHDSICGCSVDAVHRENEVRFDQVTELAAAVENRQQYALKSALAQGQTPGWWVLHQGDSPYTGVVPATELLEDGDISRMTQINRQTRVLKADYLHDIQDLPQAHRTMSEVRGWIWAENLAPHALSLLWPEVPPPYPVTVSEGFLENECFSLHARAGEQLQITDRRTGRVYALHGLRDIAEQGDSYNSAPVPGASPGEGKLVKVSAGLAGPLVGSLVLEYEVPASGIPLTVITTVSLAAARSWIEFESGFTNTAEDHKLQVCFPTGSPVENVLAESHFGVETRCHDPAYREADYMPAPQGQELATNTGPIQRFLLANAQAWFTEGLTEYEVCGDEIRLTLLRAFGYLSKGDTGVRGAQAGPPFATPEGQCLNRRLTARYAWAPLPSGKDPVVWAYHEADRFYGVVSAQNAGLDSPASLSLIQWDNPAVISSTVKLDMPGSGLILRWVNITAQAQSIQPVPGFGYRSAFETDFLEVPVARLDLGLPLEFEPFEVKTVWFQLQ